MLDIRVKLPDGQSVFATPERKFSFWMGASFVTLTSVYYIHGMDINSISCSILDKKWLATTIKNEVCHLTDKRDGETFRRLNKRKSDGLLGSTIWSCETKE